MHPCQGSLFGLILCGQRPDQTAADGAAPLTASGAMKPVLANEPLSGKFVRTDCV